MGIGDIISRIFKTHDEKLKNLKTGTSLRNNPDNPIDSPYSEDINYLKTEKIIGTEKKQHLNVSENKTQKKNLDYIDDNKLNKITDANILDVLSNVYDPEIPIDIVNLGLIYDINIHDDQVDIKMTMTAPGCPASAQITAEAKYLIEELEGIKEANIEIVWDPPWDPSRMSDDAKQSLGYM